MTFQNLNMPPPSIYHPRPISEFLNISLNSSSTVNLFGSLLVVVTLLTVSGSLLWLLPTILVGKWQFSSAELPQRNSRQQCRNIFSWQSLNIRLDPFSWKGCEILQVGGLALIWPISLFEKTKKFQNPKSCKQLP